MGFLVELFLIAILLLFLYEKPKFLGDFAHSTLGKIVMVLVIVGIAKTRGLVGGVLAALVMVLLLHTYKEGLTGNSNKKKKPGCAPGDKKCKKSSKHSSKHHPKKSHTNQMDNENFLNRGAVEATISASKQFNDQTNN